MRGSEGDDLENPEMPEITVVFFLINKSPNMWKIFLAKNLENLDSGLTVVLNFDEHTITSRSVGLAYMRGCC